MATTPVDYRYQGTFDRTVFRTEFDRLFKKNGRYSATAIPDMLVLLSMIERDVLITDIRWAAYMLATAFWETASPTLVEKPMFNKAGKPLLDKAGKQIVRKSHPWLMQMRPVDEVGHGKGRDYHEPVKVFRMSDGRVRITEQDGDQFYVNTNGSSTLLAKGPHMKYPNAKVGNDYEGKGVMGTKDGGAAHATYLQDAGTEIAYFGRGYVQLTWWANYAAAGKVVGRGLDLLLDPEISKQPEIAYALMSDGMRNGTGFANKKHFGLYFSGQSRDYVGARYMVNIQKEAGTIAKIAESFEAILFASRKP